MDLTYYIAGLQRQASAQYARRYLGIENANGEVILTNFDNSVITAGYVNNQTPLWNDVRVPLSGAGPGTSPPDFTTDFIGGVKAWRFVNAAPVKSLHWEIQLPHGFNKDPALGIRIHLHWSSPTNIAALGQVVEWNMEIAVADLGSRFASVPGVVGTTTTFTKTGATSATYQHVETDLATLVGYQDSAVIVGRLYRGVGAGDTYTGNDVFALSMDAHYPIQTAGSLTEFP